MKKLIMCATLIVGVSTIVQAQAWATKLQWPIVPIRQSYTVGDKPATDWFDGPPVLDLNGYPIKEWLDRHPEYVRPEAVVIDSKKK